MLRDAFADGGPQQAELVRQDADGQVVFLLVLDHFVDLVFHADVDAVVTEDAFVRVLHLVEGGEVAVDIWLTEAVASMFWIVP